MPAGEVGGHQTEGPSLLVALLNHALCSFQSLLAELFFCSGDDQRLFKEQSRLCPRHVKVFLVRVALAPCESHLSLPLCSKLPAPFSWSWNQLPPPPPSYRFVPLSPGTHPLGFQLPLPLYIWPLQHFGRHQPSL